MKTLTAGLGRALEITAAAYGWLLVAVYAAAVIVAFVWWWPAGLMLLVPAVIGGFIWLDS
jgi:hypothetical protein